MQCSGTRGCALPSAIAPCLQRLAARQAPLRTQRTPATVRKAQGRPIVQRSLAAGDGNGSAAAAASPSREGDVLRALGTIIDPDFGMSIVDCGFVKDLAIDPNGLVAFRLELTTPACPVKGEFEREARARVGALPWVTGVDLKMDARPAPALLPDDGRPGGLSKVAHIIAVSSCKGGVGKSTTAVNLAFMLAQMGAKVGIFDADVYGPSLPTMISPELRVLQMDPETKAITPVEYLGVKAVSFGFAGQGSAIMRGPMVSGVIQQLLTTTDWGELDYLIVDFPPGTGDIQLTLCQTVAFSAAVIVTTPQKLAFIDVAKGIRMFAKLMVPCVAVVENMSYFTGDDGKKYKPFGEGSGDRIQHEFGLPHLIRFPIEPGLSAAGDGGEPLVVSTPTSATAQAFGELGAAVVREVAKLRQVSKSRVRFDAELHAIVVRLPAGLCSPAPAASGSSSSSAQQPQGQQQQQQRQEEEFYLHPATVRRNDTSAASIDEWTGARLVQPEDIPEGISPAGIGSLGNYAAQISWEDGFNQVAPFELLAALPRLDPADLPERAAAVAQVRAAADAIAAGGGSGAQQILQSARAVEQR